MSNDLSMLIIGNIFDVTAFQELIEAYAISIISTSQIK